MLIGTPQIICPSTASLLKMTSNTSVDFGAWTLTTALFNKNGDAKAAKGLSSSETLPAYCSRHPYSLATIPFIFLFYFFYDIAYTPMLVAYTLEILPFNIRAKGFAVMVRFSSSAQRVQVFSSQ